MANFKGNYWPFECCDLAFESGLRDPRVSRLGSCFLKPLSVGFKSEPLRCSLREHLRTRAAIMGRMSLVGVN